MVVHGGTAVDPPLGGSRYSMWSCFNQSLIMVCDHDGMCSIWLYMDDLLLTIRLGGSRYSMWSSFSESGHESLVLCLIWSRFFFCSEAGIIVCCPQVVAYSHAIYLNNFIFLCMLLRIGMVHFTGDCLIV